MPNYTLGKDCKAYYGSTALTASTNSAYTTGVSSATELTNVKDLTVNLSSEKIDVGTRASGDWMATAPGRKDGTITFNMQWSAADAGFVAIKNAWLNKTEIPFYALDGDKATSGKQGPAGNFNVTNFTRNEPLNEAVTVDVELSPSSYNGWFTVGGS